MPDENFGPEIPNAGEQFPEYVARPVVDGRVNGEGSTIPAVPDEQPSPGRSRPQALQANWTAALNPGLRGDVGRPMGGYPSAERPRAATYQVAVEPQAAPADHSGRPGNALPMAGNHPPEQPNGKPIDRWRDAQPARGLPVALDGFCPVELGEQERWVPGDPRWSVAYQGRTYLFHGPAQRQRFLVAPGRFAPAYSADDPVLAVDGNRRVPGRTDYCVLYDGRLYMFSSPVTLARFKANPGSYAVNGRE